MSQLKSFNVSNEIMRAQKNGHAGSTLARVVWKKQFTSASHASSSAQADDPVYTDVSDESQGCGGCPASALTGRPTRTGVNSCRTHSMRRVEIQSIRDVATGSIARLTHQATSSPKLWLSR